MQLIDWDHFAEKLVHRFRKWELETLEVRLSNIQQITIVAKYQSRFEALTNETTSIGDHWFVHFWISTLRPKNKSALVAHEPTKLDQAVSLALVHE